MQEITVEATMERIAEGTDFVNAFLSTLGCPEHVRIQVDVAIDELFGNIVRYAYAPGSGQATVRVDAQEEPLSAVITFIDCGAPFDPVAEEQPDTTGLLPRVDTRVF